MLFSNRELNKSSKRLFAISGRFFRRLNLIISLPGEELFDERRAIENSSIVNGLSREPPLGDVSRRICSAGTESGQTFFAKSNIHRLEYSSLSLENERLRMLRATLHMVLNEVSRESSSIKLRQ